MYTIETYHHRYLDDAARLYEQVYGVSPYENRTAFDISREVIIDHTLRDSFIGVVALDDQDEVVGFAWGYNTPNNPRITRIVSKRMGQEWVENTFMVEAFGIHFEHVHGDLGRLLHSGLIERVESEHYDRLRIRLDKPRMDNLPAILNDEGWQDLGGLAHVVWMGYTI